MKILNLYAGVGGNRMYWGNDHDITAVELNPSVAAAYADLYPNDTVIVGDAHQYLLDHYHEFDFIWASPPCQSHSQIRQMKARFYRTDKGKFNGCAPVYPDMKLWQEIRILQHHAGGVFVIENVIPYYKPLIQPTFTIQRHHFWSNKFIFSSNFERDRIDKSTTSDFESKFNIDLSKYKFDGIDKRQVLRNMVAPELGKYIFEQITKGN